MTGWLSHSIATHHEVTKPDKVVESDLACRHTSDSENLTKREEGNEDLGT